MSNYLVMFSINNILKSSINTDNISLILNSIDYFIDCRFYETSISNNELNFFIKGNKNVNDNFILKIICQNDLQLVNLQNKIEQKINTMCNFN
jgi:hypothetical protein